MEDRLCRATLFDGNARAVIISSTNLVQEARNIHACAPTAAAALGRALTGTLLLASTLKGTGDSLTVSIKGGGPAGSVVCVGSPDGVVKGYVENPLADPPRVTQGKLDVGAAVGRNGSITVIKDMGLKEPFVGHARLVSGEIGEDIASYLLLSEQTPSLIALGVLCRDDTILGAGGVMLQPMPGCTDDVIDRLEAHAHVLSDLSRLCADADSFDALTSVVLGELPHEILDETPVRFECACDRARIERVLLSLGRDELRDMIEQDGKAQVCCQFCARQYNFTKTQLEDLLNEGLS